MSSSVQVVVSALLGAAWYSVLLIPSHTRIELLGGNGRSPVWLALLMILASVAVSSPLWRLVRPRRVVTAAALGLVMPVGVALAFSSFVFATDVFSSLPRLLHAENPSGPVAAFLGGILGLAGMFCIGVPITTYIALEHSIQIVLPMGLLHIAVIFCLSSERIRTPSLAP